MEADAGGEEGNNSLDLISGAVIFPASRRPPILSLRSSTERGSVPKSEPAWPSISTGGAVTAKLGPALTPVGSPTTCLPAAP